MAIDLHLSLLKLAAESRPKQRLRLWLKSPREAVMLIRPPKGKRVTVGGVLSNAVGIEGPGDIIDLAKDVGHFQ